MTQEQFDAYMTRLDAIADKAVARLDLSSFTLTAEERSVLDMIPEELIQRMSIALGRYTPVGVDNRWRMVTKALVQAWRVGARVKEAVKAGYEATA